MEIASDFYFVGKKRMLTHAQKLHYGHVVQSNRTGASDCISTFLDWRIDETAIGHLSNYRCDNKWYHAMRMIAQHRCISLQIKEKFVMNVRTVLSTDFSQFKNVKKYFLLPASCHPGAPAVGRVRIPLWLKSRRHS